MQFIGFLFASNQSVLHCAIKWQVTDLSSIVFFQLLLSETWLCISLGPVCISLMTCQVGSMDCGACLLIPYVLLLERVLRHVPMYHMLIPCHVVDLYSSRGTGTDLVPKWQTTVRNKVLTF